MLKVIFHNKKAKFFKERQKESKILWAWMMWGIDPSSSPHHTSYRTAWPWTGPLHPTATLPYGCKPLGAADQHDHEGNPCQPLQ